MPYDIYPTAATNLIVSPIIIIASMTAEEFINPAALTRNHGLYGIAEDSHGVIYALLRLLYASRNTPIPAFELLGSWKFHKIAICDRYDYQSASSTYKLANILPKVQPRDTDSMYQHVQRNFKDITLRLRTALVRARVASHTATPAGFRALINQAGNKLERIEADKQYYPDYLWLSVQILQQILRAARIRGYAYAGYFRKWLLRQHLTSPVRTALGGRPACLRSSTPRPSKRLRLLRTRYKS